MHSLANFLILPLTIFWLFLMTGMVFFLFKHKKTSLIFGFLSILWLTMIFLPFLPSMLVKSLESSFPPLLDTSKVPKIGTIYILVLGGGQSEGKNLSPIEQLPFISQGRLSEGIRLH